MTRRILSQTKRFPTLLAVAGCSLALAACSGSEDATENTILDGGAGPTPTPVDSQPPQISILTPDDDGRAETSSTVISLTGQASDNVDVQSLGWSSNRGDSGDITVSSNWISPQISVFSGSNVITVTAEDAAGNTASDTITIVFEPNSAPEPAMGMVSFNPDLTNPIRLADNTISRQFAYLFFEPNSEWIDRGVSRVEFSCCRSVTGTPEPHLPTVTDSAAPWALPIDLVQFAAGTRRELSIDVIFADNGERVTQRVEFNLATASGGNNRAPIISGNAPGTVVAGENYSFVPTASDPDGDMLTFSVSNLPRWASFDPVTGEISGTPANGDVGLFRNIRIRVSDGINTVSLPRFDVQVDAVALRSVTLNWTPPTRREDGSPLNGLSGYQVYYGQVSGVYPNRRSVNDGSISSFTLDSLQPGTWYVAITSIDNNGLESALSNEVAKQAQ
ncbi:MAG: putative Ig domain-containing protein [Pseudomonadota bacterium]